MKEISMDIDGQPYSLQISNSIGDFKIAWDNFASKNVYFNSNYITLLESYGPLDYHYYYAFAKMGNRPIGIIYFQRKKVDLSKDFRIHSHSNNIFEKLRVALLKQFFKLIKNDILILGNVLLTGEYAFRFEQDVDMLVRKEILESAIKNIKDFIKVESQVKIKTTLVKDFYIGDTFKKSAFSLDKFTQFNVQPDMIVTIDPTWQNFDDYINSVKSKYRVKFNKVISKAEDIEFRELNQDQLEIHNAAMYALYESTADRALFSLFKLNPYYFKELKRAMPDHVSIFGVFKEDKLVAFYTFIQNDNIGDAHFLGYDVSLNAPYQLYFNILLRLIDLAIAKKVSYLNLSRTALEIKSSVGAEPYDMNIYMQYHQRMLNDRLPWILDKIVPKNNWQQRSPFK